MNEMQGPFPGAPMPSSTPTTKVRCRVRLAYKGPGGRAKGRVFARARGPGENPPHTTKPRTGVVSLTAECQERRADGRRGGHREQQEGAGRGCW